MAIARKLSFVGLALMGVVAGVSAAEAVTYKFYGGVSPPSAAYTGPYSEPGTIYAATAGDPTLCPTPAGSCPGTDLLTDPMVFGSPFPGSPGVTATAPGDLVVVWNDLAPNYGGLGVGALSQGSDADQIEGGDILTLTFDFAVTLTGVATLFDGPHTPFGAGFPDVQSVSDAADASPSVIAFMLSVDGGAYAPVLFNTANMVGGLSIDGTIFSFMQAENSPSFYVSALAIAPPGVPPPPVPIPAAFPLFASALAGLGLWGRRRRPASAG